MALDISEEARVHAGVGVVDASMDGAFLLLLPADGGEGLRVDNALHALHIGRQVRRAVRPSEGNHERLSALGDDELSVVPAALVPVVEEPFHFKGLREGPAKSTVVDQLPLLPLR